MLVGIQQHPSFASQTYFNYKTFYSVQWFSTAFGIRPIFEMHRGMWPGYKFFSFSCAFLAFGPFSKHTEACGPVTHFLVFMCVFGIWPIFEIHKACGPDIHLLVFSFSAAFLAFCPFSKHTEACGPDIHLLVFISVFGIWPIFEIHRGMWPDHIFSRFLLRFFAFVGFKSFLAFCPFSKCIEGMCSGHIFSRFHARPQKSYQSKFQKCCPTKIKKNKSRKSFPFQQLKKG